ncbi:MAG: hypothetical protein ACFWUC_02395 [Oscillospiraceae bacterium]|jgi:hypothetical protein
MRSCLYMIGPGDVIFTPTAVKSISGESTISPNAEHTMSKERLQKLFNRLSIGTLRILINGLPIVLVMAVIPLIVHWTIVHLDYNEACLFGQSIMADLYSQAKALWLLIAGGILIILCGVNYKGSIINVGV